MFTSGTPPFVKLGIAPGPPTHWIRYAHGKPPSGPFHLPPTPSLRKYGVLTPVTVGFGGLVDGYWCYHQVCDTLEEMEQWMDTTGKGYGEENTGVANVVEYQPLDPPTTMVLDPRTDPG